MNNMMENLFGIHTNEDYAEIAPCYVSELPGLLMDGEVFTLTDYSTRRARQPPTPEVLEQRDGWAPIPVGSELLSRISMTEGASDLHEVVFLNRYVLTKEWNTRRNQPPRWLRIQLEPRIEDVVDLGDYWSIRGNCEIYADDGECEKSFSSLAEILAILRSPDTDSRQWGMNVGTRQATVYDTHTVHEFVSDDTKFCTLVEKEVSDIVRDNALSQLRSLTEAGGRTAAWTREMSCVDGVFSSFYNNCFVALDDRGDEEWLLMQMCSETMNWDEMEHLLMNKVDAQNRKSTRFERKCLIPDNLKILDAENALSLTGLGFSRRDGLFMELYMSLEDYMRHVSTDNGSRPPSGATLHDYIMPVEHEGESNAYGFVLRESTRLTRGSVVKALAPGLYVLRYSSYAESTEVSVGRAIDVLKEVQVSYIRSRVSLSRGVGAVNTVSTATIDRTTTNRGRLFQTDRKDTVRKI